ncbi:hypothetical protein IH824_14490, partial [candidate division KSB1 bacterium]|nr:hypothetical protein [candidate division KSB1 bacterium]
GGTPIRSEKVEVPEEIEPRDEKEESVKFKETETKQARVLSLNKKKKP